MSALSEQGYAHLHIPLRTLVAMIAVDVDVVELPLDRGEEFLTESLYKGKAIILCELTRSPRPVSLVDREERPFAVIEKDVGREAVPAEADL